MTLFNGIRQKIRGGNKAGRGYTPHPIWDWENHSSENIWDWEDYEANKDKIWDWQKEKRDK